MTTATTGPKPRPLSPHAQIWRWHLTMACSILHRISGVALYVGALIFAGWIAALAAGPDAYEMYRALLGSILGKVAMFGLTAALMYHLANGVRHLIWDSGHGLDIKSANASAVFAVGFAAVATIAIWIVAYKLGAV